MPQTCYRLCRLSSPTDIDRIAVLAGSEFRDPANRPATALLASLHERNGDGFALLVEETFGVTVPDDLYDDLRTVGDAVRLIEEQIAAVPSVGVA